MSSAHPSGFIILGWLTTSEGQICSDPKGHAVPAVESSQILLTSHLHFHLAGLFLLKTKVTFQAAVTHLSFSN